MPATRSLDEVGDDYLVDRVRQGYLPAYEELVRRHQQRTYTLALRMVDDAHEAHDLTQEALVRAWRSLPSFGGRSAFGTWLHRITMNVCLDHLRRRQRLAPHEPDPQAPGPDDVQHQVEAGHRDQALRQVVGELPLDQRGALVLTTFMGYSYEDAADVLQTTPDAVRGRATRARAAIARQMGAWR